MAIANISEISPPQSLVIARIFQDVKNSIRVRQAAGFAYLRTLRQSYPNGSEIIANNLEVMAPSLPSALVKLSQEMKGTSSPALCAKLQMYTELLCRSLDTDKYQTNGLQGVMVLGQILKMNGKSLPPCVRSALESISSSPDSPKRNVELSQRYLEMFPI
jgi:hypothetical protein